MLENLKIAFLIYDSRSGSTLLSRLLNEYKDVYVTAESAFISRLINSRILNNDNVSVSKIISFLTKEQHFRELNLDLLTLNQDLNKLIRLKKLSLRYVILAILEQLTENESHKDLIIIKHPLYEHLDEMLYIFPKAHIIHLIRDPRALHNSKANSINLNGSKFSDNPIKTSLKYRYKTNLLLRFREKNRDAVIDIRYQDLISKTEIELSRIIDFCGLTSTKTYSSNYLELIGSSQKSLHELVGHAPVEGRIIDWKSKLSIYEIDSISLLTKEIIVDFDFEAVKKKANRLKLLFYMLWKYTLYVVHALKNNLRNLISNRDLLKSKFRYLKFLTR